MFDAYLCFRVQPARDPALGGFRDKPWYLELSLLFPLPHLLGVLMYHRPTVRLSVFSASARGHEKMARLLFYFLYSEMCLVRRVF